MNKIITKNDIMFNCYLLLELADFDCDNIEPKDLKDVFDLDMPCRINDCKKEYLDGLCEHNHYIPLYRLTQSLFKFLKNADEKVNKDKLVDTIIENHKAFKEYGGTLPISIAQIKCMKSTVFICRSM